MGRGAVSHPTPPPLWRRIARRGLSAPVVRLVAPGWPDAGRKVVQRPALESLISRAAERVRGKTGIRRALNAGAGEGLHTPVIRRFVGDALLLEFDMSRPAKRPADGERFCASLTAVPLPDASVDLAVCTEVLEHVPDDERAIAELTRVLMPRGVLVLSVPTPPAVFDPAHVREGYTLQELTTLFERHGLLIEEARYCMHACFKLVLQYWRPYRVPLGVIVGIAWLDRWLRLGKPMDLIVLARRADFTC
jgi:SAM-dependent methyltransferase